MKPEMRVAATGDLKERLETRVARLPSCGAAEEWYVLQLASHAQVLSEQRHHDEAHHVDRPPATRDAGRAWRAGRAAAGGATLARRDIGPRGIKRSSGGGGGSSISPVCAHTHPASAPAAPAPAPPAPAPHPPPHHQHHTSAPATGMGAPLPAGGEAIVHDAEAEVQQVGSRGEVEALLRALDH